MFENVKIIVAIPEERLCKSKNYEGFSFLAVEQTLKRCNLEQENTYVVAMSSRHTSFPITKEESSEYFKISFSITSRIKQLLKTPLVKRVHRKLRRKRGLRTLEKAGFREGKAVFVEHHLCHASTTYCGSPFRGRKVLIITCDQAGDDLYATVNIGHWDGRIDRVVFTQQGGFPWHALGIGYFCFRYGSKRS